MRFMYDSYDKIFPRQEAAPEQIESAVESFKPTQDMIEGIKEQPETPTPVQVQTGPAQPVRIPQPEPVTEPIQAEGTDDGTANTN